MTRITFSIEATIRHITDLKELGAFADGLKARGAMDEQTQGLIALRKIELQLSLQKAAAK